MSERNSRDDQLRVGTAQRESAMEVLRNAAADERLTFDELESRVGRTIAALTRADLRGVLDDLLTESELTELVTGEPPRGEGVGYSYDNPLVIDNHSWWKRLEKVGPWEVPPFLEVSSNIGGILLDFMHAKPMARIIDVTLVVTSMGSTLIVVPEGWGVDTLALNGEPSYFETKGVRTRPAPGLPRIIISGRTAGTVKVRVGTERDARHALRVLQRQQPALPPA